MCDYKFTVFTPTYNRAYTLGAVYESLQKQTYKDFEWIIVDDGSTDDTKKLVETWIADNQMPIRYYFKENGGKHTAINYGVQRASGELFLIFDSDDTCTPDALEVFNKYWESIDIDQRENYSGVSCLCMDTEGNVIGDKFPGSPFVKEANSLNEVKGEKWGFIRTDIIKEHKFPEIINEKFIAESIVWNRIARKYNALYINYPLRIFTPLPDGLSSRTIYNRVSNPCGTVLVYNEMLEHNMPCSLKLKSAINYSRFSFHAGVDIKNIFHSANSKIICTGIPVLLGYIMYFNDIRVGRKAEDRVKNDNIRKF